MELTEVIHARTSVRKYNDVQAIIAIGTPDEGMYSRPRKSIDEVLIKR